MQAKLAKTTDEPLGSSPQYEDLISRNDHNYNSEITIEMVREGGLEPPHLTAYAPQTYVSTSSTTRAKGDGFIFLRLFKVNHKNAMTQKPIS